MALPALVPSAADIKPMWAVSPSAARRIAAESDRPIIAIVWTGFSRMGRITETLADPSLAPVLSKFILTEIDNPQDYEALASPRVDPSLPQMVFINAKGRVLRRVSGYLWPEDIRYLCEQVQWSVAEERRANSPNRLLVNAMRGEVKSCEASLAASPRKPDAVVAETYGVMGDELRCEGEAARAADAYAEAVVRSGCTEQKARWSLRRSSLLYRVGRMRECHDEAVRCLAFSCLPESRRTAARYFTGRGTYALR